MSVAKSIAGSLAGRDGGSLAGSVAGSLAGHELPGGVLVVGGGLAGAAAAIGLARAGRAVTLLEREADAHHKVCGEFLSQEALESLAALGLDAAALGAVPIRSVDFSGRRVPLPFAAMSLTRRRLDEALLQTAAAAGVTVRRPVTVRGLSALSNGWQVALGDGSHCTAATVFLATGKHDVRGRLRPAGRQSDLTGFKMYWRLATGQVERLSGCVELHTFRGGYAGLQPVEEQAANLCCLINRRWLRMLRGDWDALLDHMQQDSPRLAERLRGAEPLLARPLAISAIPYGMLRAATEDRLWHLGDQAAVIPSFTGDGMSIALHSGRLAAALYLQGASAGEFQQRLHDELRGQVALATRVSAGLVAPMTQPLLLAAARLWPGALGSIARHTRIDAQAHASATQEPMAVR